MDPWVANRLKYPVLVHPHTGTSDGSPTFGVDITLNTFYSMKDSLVINSLGEEVQSKASIILRGDDIAKVHTLDEVTLPILGRIQVIAIAPYLSFKHAGYECVEVFV